MYEDIKQLAINCVHCLMIPLLSATKDELQGKLFETVTLQNSHIKRCGHRREYTQISILSISKLSEKVLRELNKQTLIINKT